MTKRTGVCPECEARGPVEESGVFGDHLPAWRMYRGHVRNCPGRGKEPMPGTTIVTTIPNPGSPEAGELGCKCPVLDNCRGRGPGPFWVVEGCPLHHEPLPAQEPKP